MVLPNSNSKHKSCDFKGFRRNNKNINSVFKSIKVFKWKWVAVSNAWSFDGWPCAMHTEQRFLIKCLSFKHLIMHCLSSSGNEIWLYGLCKLLHSVSHSVPTFKRLSFFLELFVINGQKRNFRGSLKFRNFSNKSRGVYLPQLFFMLQLLQLTVLL